MSLQTRINTNLDGFLAKLKLISEVSKKTLPDQLNKQMLQLIVGAKGSRGLVQLTAKATEARIRSDLAKTVTYRLPGGRAITGRLSRILAAQFLHRRGDKITEGALDGAEAALIKARIQSRAYIAASWLWAAQALAPFVKGNTLSRLRDKDIPLKSDGDAYNAFDKTKAAVPGRLRVSIYNTARGADIIASKAVPRALNNAAKDMAKYIEQEKGKAYARLK